MHARWSGQLHLARYCIIGLLAAGASAKSLPGQPVETRLAPVPIGAATVDITPDFPVRLTGYGSRTQETTEIAQRIWAKALAIGSDADPGPAILLAVENCGMTEKIRLQVARRLQDQVGLPDERLVITVTHTHTAPCLTDWAPYIFGQDIPPDQQARIDRYTGDLIDRMVEVSLKALRHRRPARLYRTTTTAGFAVNRRVLQDGQWSGFGVQTDGPVDHSLSLLVAIDAQDKPLAVVANYACHCTTLGGRDNEISGDWAGYAAQYLQEDLTGVVAMITIGCGADANPEPRGSDQVAQRHGRELADQVLSALRDDESLTPVPAEVRCLQTTVDLPFSKLPSREDWEQTARDGNKAEAYHAAQFLKRLDRGEKIPATLPYPVATWLFGDEFPMVFLAGEVVVDYAIRLRREFRSDLWITAYANSVPCYIPSARILREGGYEADRSMLYYARPSRLSESAEQLIVDSVQKLLPARFYSAEKQRDFPPARAPEEALRSIKVPAGWMVELVASEPLVVDPVAFDWSSDGRLWVVEMRDYPNGMGWQNDSDPRGIPGGRVKVLTDTDRDGKYDQASILLDDLPFPTGIKVWRNGVLVTAAPDIIYAEDTDGDGRADKREILYHGFGEGNQQHRVNGLQWSLDGWLHVSNGDSGGRIQSTKTGKSLELGGRDLRIRPDEGALETQSGRTQFGRSRDNLGNWFGGNNSNPMWHYVLDDQYLSRNPHYAAGDIRHPISRQPGPAPVYPISRTLTRFNDFTRANRFTSACSPIVFRDDSLIGTEFDQYTYVCEPVHNLVHREILTPSGVTFSSRRLPGEQQSEVLASDDNWFRPVMIRTGPDGALWIADMYRFVIEHPQWIPQDTIQRLDLRAGENQGRIYRVRIPEVPSPTGWRTAQLPRLDQLTAPQLVAELDCANGTRRDMIHQLLYWSKDPAAVKPLKQLLADPRWVQSAIHALYLLDEFGRLTDDLLLHQIQHSEDEIKRHAIRIAERRLNSASAFGPLLLDQIRYGSSRSTSLHVSLQLAYSLGEWRDPRAGTGLAQLLIRYSQDKYLTAAVFSSINRKNLSPLLTELRRPDNAAKVSREVIQRLFRMAAALDQKAAVEAALAPGSHADRVDSSGWQLAAVLGLLDTPPASRRSFIRALSDPARQVIQRQLSRARNVVDDRRVDDADRLVAIHLLNKAPDTTDDDVHRLAALLTPRVATNLQEAAVEALGSSRSATAVDALLRDWSTLSPDIRGRVFDVVLRRPASTKRLLDAIEQGQIAVSFLDARRRQQLTRHVDPMIRQRAERLFKTTSADRAQVMRQFASALTLTPDADRGRQLFDKHCSKCHRVNQTGHDVGPDLVALTDKSAHSLLVAILDPNRAVEDKFLDYMAVTTEGLQYTGMITAETASSVTLTGPDARQQTILRNQIEHFQSSGKSLMPEGIEKDLKAQDLADVIAYVRKLREAAKPFLGNRPALARSRPGESLSLHAAHCRIYGPRLVFEQKYRNLGWWASDRDRAIWALHIPAAGKYRVLLDYACADDSAGNRFQLSIAGQSIIGTVAGTGSWDDYMTREVGQIELPAGTADAVMQSVGKLKSSLLDLRTIHLEPVSR